MEPTKKDYLAYSRLGKLLPQEETLEISKSSSSLTIGIPKETSFQENRVSLVPDAVGLLINNGHHVIIETNAGKAAHFQDAEYNDYGAEIVSTAEEAFQADIILKVAPPSEEELNLIKPHQTIISALHETLQSAPFYKKCMTKKVTALAFEYIRDKDHTFPIVRSLSEIAGNTAILIASEYLSTVNDGKGLMMGGITGVSSTDVVILGAGTVAEFAARAAMGLGATVKVFDNSIYKLRRFQNTFGSRVYTSIIQPKVILKALRTADVVIGAIHAPQGRTPCIITEEMVSEMKYGSVIVDVSIDQGGCFETSRVTNHKEPVFRKDGVIHYCVPNIGSRVSRTASYALSNILTPILLNMSEEGGVEKFVKSDYGFRQGVYVYNGILTKKYIGDNLNLPYQDIELLTAAL